MVDFPELEVPLISMIFPAVICFVILNKKSGRYPYLGLPRFSYLPRAVRAYFAAAFLVVVVFAFALVVVLLALALVEAVFSFALSLLQVQRIFQLWPRGPT